MSVRRLAPAELQPEKFAFTSDNENWADGQIAKYPAGRQASAVIPLLWRAQEQEGWVSQAAIETIAKKLAMAKMRVLEVATFYTMFNLEPVGKFFIQLCGTTPCRLRGAQDIIDVCKSRIGDQHHVTADGNFSWLEVECLGSCCNAPMVQINQDYYEDLTTENFNALLDNLAAGKPVRIGPQNSRKSSEPEGAVNTLQESTLYDGSQVGAWRKTFDERFEKAQAAKAEAAAAKAAETAKAAAAAPAVAQVAANAPARPMPSEGKSGATQDTPAANSSAPAVDAAKEAKALAEEKEIAAKLSTLPKDATPEQKANAVGSKPAALTVARENKAEDLKRIRGIGKVNEGKLNALGIFHFDQIAAWTRDEIRWVGTYLSFPGRIDREDWVAQAATLAKGGETEFSKRVDHGDVPTSKS